MHPSTGLGRKEAHFGDRLPWLCTLRQAQGERKRILGIVFPGCSPFDRLRANGSAFWGSSSPAVHPSTGSGRTEVQFGDRLSRLFALRQAQGERKRILGIVFPGSAPFDRLRANGSAIWGSSFPAVRPSTGSGRTEVQFGDRLSRLFALRQAQGERKCILGIVFPGSAPFDRLRANGSAFWGSSSPAVHPSTGSGRTEVQFGDRLPRLFALRQAQGEWITLSTATRIHSPSRRPRALSGIAQMPPASPREPSQAIAQKPSVAHCLRAL